MDRSCRNYVLFSFNLALSLCTDGVEIFFVASVLSHLLRMEAENTIFCVGSGKPPMLRLLEIIWKHFADLEPRAFRPEHLLVVYHSSKTCYGDTSESKCALREQYNGKYGCTVCEHPGKRLANRGPVLVVTSPFLQTTCMEGATKWLTNAWFQ